MNILKMKKETKDDIKAGLIGIIFVLLIVVVLTGCTWTFHRPPMKLNTPQVPTAKAANQYYVIDESSTIPDAYFETKDEAENYKKYFKEHHNYKIVKLQ